MSGAFGRLVFGMAAGAVSGTIAKEGSLLLLSFGFGVLLMMAYDLLRVFRQMARHGTLWTAAEDAAYWMLCAVGIFAMLYRENDGLLRWFVLAGVAAGMLVENSIISPWAVRLSVEILRAVFGILGKIAAFLAKPGRRAARRGKKFLNFLKKRLKKIGKAVKIGIRKL